jgi:hypothetical protein
VEAYRSPDASMTRSPIMAIKVEVKNNSRGFGIPFTGRCNGVSTLNGANVNGQRIGVSTMPMFANTTSFGTTLENAGFGIGQTGINGNAFPINNGLYGPATFGGTFAGQANSPWILINRMSTIDPSIAAMAWQLMQVEPDFMAKLCVATNGCPWHSMQLIRVASTDLALASEILVLASVNQQAAFQVLAQALINPFEARRALTAVTGMTGINTMPVNIQDDGLRYIVKADLQGATIDDVEVVVLDGQLVLETVVKGTRGMNTTSVNGFEQFGRTTLRQTLAIGNDIDVDCGKKKDKNK